MKCVVASFASLLLWCVSAAQAVFASAPPSLQAYENGDHERAVARFLSLVSGFDWETCRGVIDEHVPDGVANTIRDADTFFGVELPAVGAWEFGRDQAAAIVQPVLSVVGSETRRLWVEVDELLHSWFPQLEELRADGIGHFLQMQRPQPVARGVAAFFGRHPMLSRDSSRALLTATGT